VTGATVARFEIRRTAYLDADGSVLETPPAFAHDFAALMPLYRAMVLTRAFDTKAIALQRSGRLGTYASAFGQEAVGVGVASAMGADDVLLPSFRDHGAQLWRGVTLEELLLYWGGDERGSNFAGPRNDFPVCIPVASQFPHAAGVALAITLRGGQGAAVALAGDGATSKGDFYEALNVVGVWRLPAIFVINNNRWAISVPREEQTAAETLAQKAIAAGLPGEQVDGNDVIAVRDATQRALERARAGEGGTLIEALTYRLGDHTTADDASRYRDEAEVEPWLENEPLRRLREYLKANSAWSDDREADLVTECEAEIESAAEAFLASHPEAPDAMFRYVHASLTPDLERQLDMFSSSEAGDV
jgi:pyruvate dehydrogenase E1 component alpha subunit